MAMMYLFLLMLQLVPVLWLPPASAFKSGQHPPIALPGCNETCGEVLIPFPFGIGSTCSHNIDYEIVCNTSSHTPRPFLRKLSFEVAEIRMRPQVLTVRTTPQIVCASGNGGKNIVAPSVGSIDLSGSPYRFSMYDNVFMVEGCSGIVTLKDRSGETLTGCGSFCLNDTDDGKMPFCDHRYGIGCCQRNLSLTGGLDFYQIGFNESTPSKNSHACHIVASLVDSDLQANFSGRLSSLKAVSTALEWNVTGVPINNMSRCEAYTDGFYCYCLFFFGEGNPYLPDGCLENVPDEIICENNDCVKNPWLKRGLILGLSIGIGLPLLLTLAYWFYRSATRMMELRRKAKYFKRNGGLLLQQEISSNDNAVEKAKIFSVSELEKATDSFNKNRILGQGGQGTVYKGMMVDGKIVAVKKSKKVDESQLEQFINEVVILTQVNHRNVVKLLGCCLETEVPLLVYEFIPNGTLYHHIHDQSEDFQVSWKMRLQIAAESASALAYLHSSSYPPVYHRDIKSTNILLDDKYRAKVSDFGTSKVITIEQTHVTTCVQGTYGYLDPEYFQSNQFTEKSDVYSFGVVLVELITGRKPICPTKTGGWISLASEFLFHIESSSLDDILDTRLVNEENKGEFMAVAKLARQCLKMNGRRRPTMKEVAMELEGIRSHHVKNSTQPTYIAETNEVVRSRLDVSISFPDNSIANCFSIDVEPLIANSF